MTEEEPGGEDWPPLTFPEAEARRLKTAYAEAGVILEYGSGGSTLFAARLGKLVISVESDRAWAIALQNRLDSEPHAGQAIIHYVDIGPTGAWGRPLDDRAWRRFHHYPAGVWAEPFFRHPDLILIDGRFRPGCFVNACLRIERPVTVLFDDYENRPKYHVVERLFAPVAMHGRMAEFRITPRHWPGWALDLLLDLLTEATFSGQGRISYDLPEEEDRPLPRKR